MKLSKYPEDQIILCLLRKSYYFRVGYQKTRLLVYAVVMLFNSLVKTQFF